MNQINPYAVFHIVWYDVSGGGISHVRQPRNTGTATSSVLADVPNVPQPNPMGNECVTGAPFSISQPPQLSYPGANGPNTYVLSFINVTGLAEGPQLLNGYTPNVIGTVGTAPIDIWIVYSQPPQGVNGGPPPTSTGAILDAYDITKGVLMNDTFINVAAESYATPPIQTSGNPLAETANDNVQGYVDTTTEGKTILALDPSQIYPPSTVASAFVQWQIFYGPAADDKNLTVPVLTDANALALYKSPLIWNCPCPYVSGGIYSSDIKLSLNGTPVNPAAGTDASLTPNTAYTFGVMVHNDSPNDIVNTEVTFWEIPNGNGSNASLLNVQTVPEYFVMNGSTVQIPNSNGAPIIPANSSAYFKSAVPFWSGLSQLFPSDHNCAGVSVYNPVSGCCPPAATAAEFWAASGSEINSPTHAGQPSCSAWLNTNAITTGSGQPFHIHLGVGKLNPVYGDDQVVIHLEVDAKYVPVDWNHDPKVKEIAGLFRSAGIQTSYPLYLLPGFYPSLKPITLDTKITMKEGGKLTKKDKTYVLDHERGKSNSYEVSGVVPPTAKKGDVILVTVTAHYEKTHKVAAKSVSFLEFIHVTD